jgi:hypothetical protein
VSIYFIVVLVFVATFLADLCWTKYAIAANERKALAAAWWSVAIIALGAFTLIVYVHNNWLLVPELIGAFCGTYWAVKTSKQE